ncbi:MAG TPA: polyhydroxyalkanoate depolymerase, partial [Candidatus Berkiella sp.]|nr:polyhydroxyalkanoate depolymerase [Candidatus Berkiella sp.]
MNPDMMEKLFKNHKYFLRGMAGSLYVYHMLIDTYHKPAFGITGVKMDDEYYDVTEEIIKKRNFCDLLHFKKLRYN